MEFAFRDGYGLEEVFATTEIRMIWDNFPQYFPNIFMWSLHSKFVFCLIKQNNWTSIESFEIKIKVLWFSIKCRSISCLDKYFSIKLRELIETLFPDYPIFFLILLKFLNWLFNYLLHKIGCIKKLKIYRDLLLFIFIDVNFTVFSFNSNIFITSSLPQ